MLVPGIVDSDKRGSTLDVTGNYSPCDSLETAYVADNGFTVFADGVWSAVQSEHVAGLAVRSGDYLAERTEDVAVLLGVSVQNFVGDALLYVSIYDTGTDTYVGVDVGESITATQSLFVRMLSDSMYGKLRIRIDIIGDTVAFDSITLHSIYTYECPPTTEVVDCDPYWDNVVLAMHMDGSGTSFVDEKGHTISVRGAATQTTADSKFGGSSAYFDGNFLTTIAAYTPNADLNLGNTFTIELFVKADPSKTGSQYLLSFHLNNNSSSLHNVNLTRTSEGIFTIAGFGVSSSENLSEWAHLALVCNSGASSIYINGEQRGTSTFDWSTSADMEISIGAFSSDFFGGNWFKGKIDDLRITKGVARYTANFTPPTTPFAENNCDTATGVLQTAVTMGWSIGSEVSASASIGWTVGWSEDYEFDKSIAIRWSLAQNIDKVGNIAWTIQTNTNPIDKEFGFRWGIAQEVLKNVGIRWTIQ